MKPKKVLAMDFDELTARVTAPKAMNFDQALKKALEESTLLDALNWIVIWESERVFKQMKHFVETGERTGSDGAAWDTCFRYCLKGVMEAWAKRRDLTMAQRMMF